MYEKKIPGQNAVSPVETRTRRVTTPQSQSDIAYERLKSGLTTLAYKPGEYLNASSLMTEFGLGRTPIIQALHRLSTEGLVHILPRKGVMVAPLSIDDALHLIEVRIVNEALCVRLAAERISPKEIEQLEMLSQQIETAVRSRDLATVLTHDKQFHDKITLASGNPVLVELLGLLQARSQRFWALSLSNETHLDEVLEEHSEVLRALKHHDSKAAVLAIQKHIESFQHSLLKGRSL
ncbi:GntR family transcriptional regulator [Ottowia caeni]|uniref:GntR family transcriptional regulator n=1 Tax=Ottowia caeni TaxID=2870339 RepID=UPI001E5BE8E9|nr:GntR family transcriptional regulator [Ottowia caeni]